MIRKANENKGGGSVIVVLLGPEHSPTAMRRGQRCFWILQKEGPGNVIPVIIDSWDEAEAWEGCAGELNKAITEMQDRILIFCADDYIMLYVDRMIRNQYGAQHKDRIFLFGYDGVKNIDNSLLVNGAGMFWATVSQEPEELGRAAFRMLYFSYNKRVAVKNQFVEPRLITAEEVGTATTGRR